MLIILGIVRKTLSVAILVSRAIGRVLGMAPHDRGTAVPFSRSLTEADRITHVPLEFLAVPHSRRVTAWVSYPIIPKHQNMNKNKEKDKKKKENERVFTFLCAHQSTVA